MTWWKPPAATLPSAFPTIRRRPCPAADGKPFVILVVGVNGTGKTTSSAKLGLWLKNRGRSVMLAAADTFRAAAVEQLQRWGDRLDLPVVKGNPNADPSSVCFNAHQKAIADGTAIPHLRHRRAASTPATI